jgi:hypothetical protein
MEMRGGELGFILVVLLVVSGCGVSASSPVEKMSAKNSEALADGVDATKNPEATFKGCWHKSGKNQYQAVDVSVKNSGKYAFNAVLYYGTGCGAGDFADQFGFGQIISFGGFEDTFWFTAFANKKDMSALWYVGEDKSECVDYEVAGEC